VPGWPYPFVAALESGRTSWASVGAALRSVRKPDEIAYHLGYSPLDASVDDLLRVAGTKWAIEECFRAAKNECGLDQ
jgi:SRSO17 transposase